MEDPKNNQAKMGGDTEKEIYFNSPSSKHYIDMDLPKHWFRYFSDENEEYFYNEITGETTWEKPEDPKQSHESQSPTVIALANHNASDSHQPDDHPLDEQVSNLHLKSGGEGPEVPFDKSSLVEVVNNNNGNAPFTRRTISPLSEPVAVPVPVVLSEQETEPVLAVEVNDDRELISNNDTFAGNKSPLIHEEDLKPRNEKLDYSKYYTTAPIITNERIMNYKQGTLTGVSPPAPNPFDNDEDTSNNNNIKSTTQQTSTNPMKSETNSTHSSTSSSNPFANPFDDEPPQAVKPTVVNSGYTMKTNTYSNVDPAKMKQGATIANPPSRGSSTTSIGATAAPNTSSMASFTYAPPLPPSAMVSNTAVKKQSHNPFLNQPNTQPAAAAAAIPMARPVAPAPVYTRQSPLLQAAKEQQQQQHCLQQQQQQQQHQQPQYVPATAVSTIYNNNINSNVSQPQPPQPPPPGGKKPPSSIMMALKAEKEQRVSSSNTYSVQQQTQQQAHFIAQAQSQGLIPPKPPMEKRKSTPLLDAATDRNDVHAPDTFSPKGATSPMTPELMRLLQFGVKQNAATTALFNSHGNSKIALKSINTMIGSSLKHNPHASQANLFKPRVNTRIKSWLPNYIDKSQQDYHTRYVCTISFDCVMKADIVSWKVDFRYSNIKELYYAVQKYSTEIEEVNPILEQFPHASVSAGLFGIDDATRNERMNKFDLWLRELIMNPYAMTIWEVVEALFAFLEVDKHVAERV